MAGLEGRRVVVWLGEAGRSQGRRWVGCQAPDTRWRATEGLTLCPHPPRAVNVVTCTKHTYRCHNGLCVSKSNPECDGVKDCSDGSDEKNCGEQGRAGGPRWGRNLAEPPSPTPDLVGGSGCLEERATMLIC